MKSHDHLLSKRYDPESYNCVHFVCEAGKDLYGIDRSEALELFMRPIRDKKFLPSRIKLLNPLPIGKEGCIVAFHHRDKHQSPHVGLFRMGRILHIQECGVSWMPIHVVQAFGFNRVSYYD
ncbi:hypothetical protein HCY58_11000 [Acinetobacter radioresistens]|uniref:hypothetical protein n=1 Tax=Acinetobacter radioresistens TaxID=40216 RepID=UPI002002E6F0|nr:hypothetical protein [Acinetobacter radioresistens]MCK4087575.1 hypothetical protein [Acinetobacter radioresistens]MCK4089653.1 hypothetical protein [Acinetobacter radioresistens]